MAKPGKTVVYVEVTVTEHALLTHLAAREGSHLCQFVRECINDRLVEEGDDVPLLAIRRTFRRGISRRPTQREATE